MISPSPGMIWPASTTTRSPGLQLGRGDFFDRHRCSQAIGRRVATGAAQRLGLRLAARLGQRGGEVGEQHGQKQPDVERDEVGDRDLAGRCGPARASITNSSVRNAPTSTTNMTGFFHWMSGRSITNACFSADQTSLRRQQSLGVGPALGPGDGTLRGRWSVSKYRVGHLRHCLQWVRLLAIRRGIVRLSRRTESAQDARPRSERRDGQEQEARQ